MNELTSDLHADYAESVVECGVPSKLVKSRGWILKRQISDVPNTDAMGCYPLFACQGWSQLQSQMNTDNPIHRHGFWNSDPEEVS